MCFDNCTKHPPVNETLQECKDNCYTVDQHCYKNCPPDPTPTPDPIPDPTPDPTPDDDNNDSITFTGFIAIGVFILACVCYWSWRTYKKRSSRTETLTHIPANYTRMEEGTLT